MAVRRTPHPPVLWAFLLTGALGSAVGATLSLIARPDREDLRG